MNDVFPVPSSPITKILYKSSFLGRPEFELGSTRIVEISSTSPLYIFKSYRVGKTDFEKAERSPMLSVVAKFFISKTADGQCKQCRIFNVD